MSISRILLAAVPLILLSCAQRQQPGAATPAPPAADTPHVLHNLQPPIGGRIISGASPDSPEAFDELRHLGVRTIISVDGAEPDVAAAAARGMRYIHIPVTYATITDAQRLELARAVRDHPGGVYIHCHHGKHRGPAATALAGVSLGMMTPEQGAEFMHHAGTAESYAGLWECIASATAATTDEIDAAPNDFPAIRKARGLTAAMVEIDFAFENLREIQRAQWRTPADHPDLVPAAEAGRLADNLRLSAEDPRSTGRGPEFLRRLMASAERAAELEEGILAREPADSLSARIKDVLNDCNSCHAHYRN